MGRDAVLVIILWFERTLSEGLTVGREILRNKSLIFKKNISGSFLPADFLSFQVRGKRISHEFLKETPLSRDQ
jgi:hypothetical protein